MKIKLMLQKFLKSTGIGSVAKRNDIEWSDIQKIKFKNDSIFHLVFDSQALAKGLVDCMDNYTDKIKRGEITAPANMRWKNQSDEPYTLSDTWNDLALEQMELLIEGEKTQKYMTIMSNYNLQNTLISRFGYLTGIPLSELNGNTSEYDPILNTIIKTLSNTQRLWVKHYCEPSTIIGGANTNKYFAYTDAFLDSLEHSLKYKSWSVAKQLGVNTYRSILQIVFEEILRLTKDVAIEALFGSHPKMMLKELLALNQANKHTADDFWNVILRAQKPNDLQNILQ